MKTHYPLAGAMAAGTMLCLLSAGPATAQTPRGPVAAVNISKIDRALQKEVKFDFVEMTLKDVATYLTDYAEIRVVVDYRGLYKAKLTGDVPITARVAGVSLETALDRMLSPIELGWIVEGEVLMLTTAEVAATRLTTREYYVADLAWRGGVPAVARIVVTSVDPPSWSTRGGEGAIRTYRTKIVVTQTMRNQRAISRLLGQLRRRP